MKQVIMPALIGIALTGMSAPQVFAQARTANLEAGSVIPVRLERELSSNKSQDGDRFTATVKADKEGYSGLPEGSIIEGVVRMAKPKQGKEPGVLDLDFRSVRLPNGRSQEIEGSLIGLDNKSVERTKDGRLVAKASKRNNRLTYVGYGAGAGILAGVLSGGKIRLENIILGAGLGYLAGSLEKNKTEVRDVSLKVGTEMGLRLDRGVTYTGAVANNSRDREGVRVRERDGGSVGNRLDRPRSGNSGRNESDDSDLDRDRDGDRDRNQERNRDTENVGVMVGEDEVRFASTAAPYTAKGIVMIPVRPVVEALKQSYSYDNGTQRVRAKAANRSVAIVVGSRIAIVNGSKRVFLEAPARRLNGVIYVPMEFFELAADVKAHWDAGSQTVLIETVSGKKP